MNRHRTNNNFTMNKNTLILLIFIVGLVCGYILNGLIDISPNSAKADQTSDFQVIDPMNPESETPIPEEGQVSSVVLVEKVLPNSSPAWMLIDLNKFQSRKDSFLELFEQESVSKFISEFTASLPRGVTEALHDLSGKSNEMRIFVMPPAGEQKVPCYVTACSLLSTDIIHEGTPFLQRFASYFPGSSTSEETIADLPVKILSTPIGDFFCVLDQTTLWISTQKEAYSQLWASPPPPELVEHEGPHFEALQNYPETAAALFLNTEEKDSVSLLHFGWIPAYLHETGIRQMAGLYRLEEKASKLTLIAPVESPQTWMAEWQPIERFPFSEADPVGLLEIAFRLPQMASPESATEAVDSTTESEQMVDAGKDARAPESGANDTGMEMREPERDDRRRRAERNGEPRRPRREERDRAQNFTRFPGNAQFGFFSQIIPKGKISGVNFFGFYDGAPALTLAFPDFDPENVLMQRLKNIPAIQPEKIDIAKIPATVYHFNESPISRMMNLDELLLIERDAVTYVFDSIDAARNYFGEIDADPEGKNRRDTELRSLLDQVRNPAQIEAVFSRDFFLQFLEWEESRYQDERFQEEIAALFQDIRPYVKPMAVSAGFSEQEFYAETYADSPVAHIIDTLLLGIAAYRSFGY